MKACVASLTDTIKTVAERYIGQNTAHSFRFRAYRTDGFCPDAEGWYSFDLNEKLPKAEMGQTCLVAAKLYQKQPEMLTVRLCCYSKTELFLNGERIWSSSTAEEIDSDRISFVQLPCQTGWNHLSLCCKKTGTGFGCRLSAAEPFWRWISFKAPFTERYGQGGFIFSRLFDRSGIDPAAIQFADSEAVSGLKWYPDLTEGSVKDPCCFEEVFGHREGTWGCLWTEIVQCRPGKKQVLLTFSGSDAVCCIDGMERKPGLTELSAGTHELLLISKCPEKAEWSVSWSAAYEDGQTLEERNPGVSGAQGKYLYLGPLDEKPDFTKPSLHRLYGTEEKCYWKIDRCTCVRPYLEEDCFGKFSYPLGVTLYGLTRTARILHRADILEYAKSHVRECASLHEYSIWDRETFGYPEINNQIVTLGCLDACGSFGSAMLEMFRDEMEDSVRETADTIAAYMENGQARLADGAFYRPKGIHPTMWADDQYMSIPFLCRYWKMSGDEKYLENAVRQVRLFRKYLYIPELKIMSHVLDFKVGKANGIPWGRGNGWTLFSISELLEYLPEDHKDRGEILSYFTELCEGYLALQGSRGLWHQVLTMPDSYEEASGTAMFIYSFCRAVRFGWVDEKLGTRLFAAACKGWDGLQSHAIDRFGNVYGICKGSLYSYDADYYKNVLGWSKNDTHGIGIVLLAGIELSELL